MSSRRLLTCSLLALVALAAPAGRAHAATTCPTAAQLEQPFLSFGDAAQYFLTSMGSFETKPWPGGTVVAGNEPFNVRRGGAADSHSLSFSRPGVTTPVICIGLFDPTIRLFAMRTAGAGNLKISVVYTGTDGAKHTIALLPISAPSNGSWVLSPPTPIIANATVLPRADGTDPVNALPSTGVRFSFMPAVGSTWQIDDVYVDPYARN
jgi:hypothetical protein